MFISISNLINSHTTSGPRSHHRNDFNWTFIKTNALSGHTLSIWPHWTGIISWMCLLYAMSSHTDLTDQQRSWLDCCGFCSTAFSATAPSCLAAISSYAHTAGLFLFCCTEYVFFWKYTISHTSDKRQRSSINNLPARLHGLHLFFFTFSFIFSFFFCTCLLTITEIRVRVRNKIWIEFPALHLSP